MRIGVVELQQKGFADFTVSWNGVVVGEFADIGRALDLVECVNGWNEEVMTGRPAREVQPETGLVWQ